jgi:alkylhydroperoxidase family enzyme
VPASERGVHERPSDDLTADALRVLAPEPFADWDAVIAAAVASATARDATVGSLVASLLGAASAPRPGGDDDDVVGRFAGQVVVDVGSLSEDARAAALTALGADAFAYVQHLYVADLGFRTSAAWRQLFGAEPRHDRAARAAPTTDLWAALDAFMHSVARLDALDPLTTEIVRLRGARAHNCRLCRSLRNVRAANDGADESVYDQIDHYETSSLVPRHRVALRLVDAILWQPAAHPTGLREDVRATFTDRETVEIVLDVARNAANKIAVALGADAAHVAAGVEYYDTDARGDLVYGLTPSR